MELSDLKQHSLRAHPKFVAAYEDFIKFLDVTLKDLDEKHQSLRTERKSLGKTQQTVKNYLDCQAFMISHHIRRLEFFRLEVNSRLAEILGSEDRVRADRLNSVGSDRSGSSVGYQKTDSVNPTFSRTDSRPLSDSSDASSRLSSPGPGSPTSDSSDSPPIGSPNSTRLGSPDSTRISSPDSTRLSSLDSPRLNSPDSTRPDSPRLNSIPCSATFALRQLMADMKTMKRRVKHVLDVTDRYSVVAKEDVPDVARPTSPLPEVARQHVVKSTVNSFCSHLAVIAKTYTRRTSHDPTELFETA